MQPFLRKVTCIPLVKHFLQLMRALLHAVGRELLTPDVTPRAEADKESLHRKWLRSQPSSGSVVRALNAHPREQQSQSSAGAITVS